MEEKKLTDEEIVKIYKHCVLGRGDCDNCPYDDWGCGIDVNDIIEIINRQKAEIERLTEENAILKGNPPIVAGRSLGKTIRAKFLAFDQMKEQNAELQKQVDELKEKLWKSKQDMMTYHSKTVAEAVKDTAKEILDEVSKHFGGAWLVELYKRYGVEVE